MKQAIDDAKSNAISAGLSGIANLLYTYGVNKHNQDVMGWGIRNNAYEPQSITGWQRKGVKNPSDTQSAKGGRIRRKRGLSF